MSERYCLYCHNTGRIDIWYNKTRVATRRCNHCKGPEPMNPLQAKCPECKGSGHLPAGPLGNEGFDPCPTCEGRGMIDATLERTEPMPNTKPLRRIASTNLTPNKARQLAIDHTELLLKHLQEGDRSQDWLNQQCVVIDLLIDIAHMQENGQ